MTQGLADDFAFRARLLSHPGERKEVDYKSSLPFDADDSFTLKLIRHIQGFSNAGGGWLVIGFAESTSGFVPDPSHAEAICATYDPTIISKRVDSSIHKAQQIKLSIFLETHPTTSLKYPIIQVQGFERLPAVCRSDKDASDTGERILKNGHVYLRRHGAETAPVSTPQDWEQLISDCVRLRRQEFLAEFRDLVERMGTLSAPPPKTQSELSDWVEEMRSRRANG